VDADRWFYRSDADWAALVDRLKLTPCPHCRAVGTLIRHGSLTGFDDARPPRKALRGRRVFCSNRHRRPGCGRTVSVWRADVVRRLGLSTRAVWGFLRRAVTGTLAAAVREAGGGRSERTLRRLWKRFDHSQSRIRTALFGRCPPPTGPPNPGSRSVTAQVLAHLRAAFPDADCPIAAFQQATGTFVLSTRPLG
jgi:hypothetical protein